MERLAQLTVFRGHAAAAGFTPALDAVYKLAHSHPH